MNIKKVALETLMIIHGNKDFIVPYIHGRILAKLIPKKYFYDFITVNNADHNNLLKYNKKIIFSYINKFLSDCLNSIDSNSSSLIENENPNNSNILNSLLTCEDLLLDTNNGEIHGNIKPKSWINYKIENKKNQKERKEINKNNLDDNMIVKYNSLYNHNAYYFLKK